MFLRSAHIRHYKSLDDVSIEFANPITVIVGPNAVGKSNLVDCLRFVRDAVRTDLEHAVSKRGGIGRVRQNSRTKPYKISVNLEFEQSFEDIAEKSLATYELTLESLTGGNYVVEHERAACAVEAWVDDRDGNPNSAVLMDVGFERGKDGRITKTNDPLERPARPDQLALGLSVLFDSLGEPIADFVGDWSYSSLYPNTLRTPSSPDKDTELAEDGSNWASVIKALKRTVRGRAALDRITEAMASVIPTFKEVTVQTVGSYLVPRFRFESPGQVTDFDPVQMSDGTLRIFGILLALYQVPPPALLVIEEPEQTVHPGVLGVLADAMREASENTQIIVTTHSPHFVDRFAPEEIRVATLVDGATRIAPVKASQVEAVKRRQMSLQEFMLAEGLQSADS